VVAEGGATPLVKTKWTIVANFLSAENIIVKEQRVDGSCINKLMLRCTLKGFERSYQIRISSYQINQIRLYSTVSGYEVKAQRELDLLNPYFVTGFTDAEGSFMVRIRKTLKQK
jgi:hypothetical protein